MTTEAFESNPAADTQAAGDRTNHWRFVVSEDVAHGQIVIVTARWLLVLTGLLLTLWNPGTVLQLQVHIIALLALAVANFYLHSQVLMKRPLADLLVYGSSLADIAVISLLISWQGGTASDVYIFYFPAILAFAVAFPPAITCAYVGVILGFYGGLYAISPADVYDLQTGVVRLLMIIAVALGSHLFWRMERRRRFGIAVALETLLAPGERRMQEAAEDLFFGQIVIIWARWFVILACAVVALWGATSASQVVTSTLVVVALMATNFFLHGRYLMERPVNRALLLAVGLVDLLLISAIVAGWEGQGGLASQLFVLYYPLLLALAFVFPPRATLLATAATCMAYSAVCLLVAPGLIDSSAEIKTLVMRMITLVAVGGLGTFYWRIQRQRRHNAHVQAQPEGVAF